ncbi:pyridoxal phosphate-dependent aminotransferase [Nocardia sp. CDC159]|uniref:Pyridoxal phosphate-dependent aminotransferase n=1 Tax=Nocardia pulmonis TaxID=2951408 RepID=A0A9X2IZH8_9NOCA|nr:MULTISPECIES: pyridoxal phosphate-dependent aminotransferase [Nocardia]MCM6778087.1 pyridoxal phosphate-dependent aminotransferase [Nocardia pulmonis]MCM6790976.1 pyridoxal phosphate-dependent aminotransferase [Nocardia sp. CDC159]
MTGTRTRPEVTGLAARSEARKREVRQSFPSSPGFEGTAGRRYTGVVDAYHGETGLPIHPSAAAALERAWREVVTGHPAPDYLDGLLYDKRQPLVLRELAAQRLFRRLRNPADGVPGVRVAPDEVVVCPYSSTMLLEEAIATLARPGGVIVCPEGFYKSAGPHIQKFGLRIIACPATPDDEFKICPEALASCLAEYRARGELCGVMLTLPGNPVVARYSTAEVLAIGRVLAEADVPVICDMAFDQMVAEYVPIAAVEVSTARGPVRLYDRVLSITGNSKGYNAFGPCKMGAACTGDTEWLTRLRARLTVAFQRETTHLARAVIEHTPEEYFRDNRAVMRAQLARVMDVIEGINRRLGPDTLRPLGIAEGMFVSLVIDETLLTAAGIDTGAQLEDVLLAVAGIDSVALDRTGSPRRGVRLNVLAPRKAPGMESPELIGELFDRLERLVADLGRGLTYREALAGRGLPVLDAQEWP